MKVPLLSATLVLAALVPPAAGSAPLDIALTPTYSMAPSIVRVRVRVEPHAENRMLQIVADADQYYRQSDVPLEGDRAPRTIQVELKNLPGGTYSVAGVLIDSTGRTRAIARAKATVISMAGEPPDDPPQ